MIFQSPAPTPWPSPIGPTAAGTLRALFPRSRKQNLGKYQPALPARHLRLGHPDRLLRDSRHARGLRRLSHQAGHRLLALSQVRPAAERQDLPKHELPRITVQLPLFNELYVVDRLLKAVTAIDYPREKLEIQVLDDSTDETVEVAEAVVAKYAAQGFDIHYIHRVGSHRLQSRRARERQQVSERRTARDLRRRLRSQA